MKKRCTILLILIFSFVINLQGAQFRILSFLIDTEDLSAVRYGRTDVNNDACALIKVYTDLDNLRFDARLGIEGDIVKKVGEYWLYVSPREKRLKIYAPDFVLLEYDIPLNIESAKVYKLSITGMDISDSEITPEIVVFESDPTGAELYIDGKLKGFTPMDLALTEGYYHIMMRKPLYNPSTFECSVSSGSAVKYSKKLEKASVFVSVKINGGEESRIYIDNMYMSEEFYDGELVVGEHLVRIESSSCESFEKILNVKSGEACIINSPCVSMLLEYEVSTEPSGVRVYCNGDYVGKSPLTVSYNKSKPMYLRFEAKKYATKYVTIETDNNNTYGYYLLESLSPKVKKNNIFSSDDPRPVVGFSSGYSLGTPGGAFLGGNINMGARKQVSMLYEWGYQYNYYNNNYIDGYAHFSRVEVGISYNIWISNLLFAEMRMMYMREKAFSLPWSNGSDFLTMPGYLKTDYTKVGVRIGVKSYDNAMLFVGIWMAKSMHTTRDEYGSFPYYGGETLNYNEIFPDREGYNYDFGIRFIL